MKLSDLLCAPLRRSRIATPRDADAPYLEILVNGRNVTQAIFASEEHGLVVRLVKNVDGPTYEMLQGFVEIVDRRSVPAKRNYYKEIGG